MASSPYHPKQNPGTEFYFWNPSKVYSTPIFELQRLGQVLLETASSWSEPCREGGHCFLCCIIGLQNWAVITMGVESGKTKQCIQKEQTRLGRVFIFIRMTPHHSSQL